MEFSSLAADTAHRFRSVSEILRMYLEELPEQPTMLDVGGYPGSFAREFTSMFPNWKATTLDRPKENLPNYISASGTRIPLGDRSFDVVISIDTYEHVPPQERTLFISELARVSRDLVVVAAPFHHNTTAGVERLLNQAHLNLFHSPHPWLSEHVENGLPALERTATSWPEPYGVVDIRRSYDLYAWVMWQVCWMLRRHNGDLDNTWNAFDAAFAGAKVPAVTSIPYRYIVVARRDARQIDIPEDFFPSPEAGLEIVEMTRFWCRLIALFGKHHELKSHTDLPVEIDQRLKEALAAAEKEILHLREVQTPQAVNMRQSAIINLKKLLGK